MEHWLQLASYNPPKPKMKTKLTTILITLTASIAFAHEGIELGPNKGRIVEFSTNETLHGEVTLQDGKLHIALLDKDMKSMKVDAHLITATAGTRENPVKLVITKDDKGFTFAAPQTGEWLILQYKETAASKAITARIEYNTKPCAPCGNPEWRCACAEKNTK
jgi:uncharacterized GH25 family protein